MNSATDLFFTFVVLFGTGLIFYICIKEYLQHERAIQKGLERIRQDITINNRLKTSRILLNRCRLKKCKKDLQNKKQYKFINLDKPNNSNHKENDDEEEENGILFLDEEN